MAIGKEGNVKWVDGLRGMASTLVVLTHIARAFDGELFLPTSAEGESPRFLQLPFLRILVQGRIGVSIFAFVTGYVCALKPIKLYSQGQQDTAFTSISKSALRRTPRLVLPAALVTLIIWFFSLFGAFEVAKHADSWWVGKTAPEYIPYLPDSIYNLFYQIIATWTQGANGFDGNQWTMLPLLKGSFMVYVFLLATAYVQPRYRMMGAVGMWLYMYCANEAAFGMHFFWGVFMCDLQNYPPMTDWLADNVKKSRILAVAITTLGLYVASYPEGHPEWMGWSESMRKFFVWILPRDAEYPRYASGIGLELIVFGLHFSPSLRETLSNRVFLWLGKQSFAVYLLHGPLLRTILCWMVYGMTLPEDVQNDKGEMVPGTLQFPGMTRLFLALPIWIPLNYGCAVLWTTYVDPWCARVTEKLVSYVKKERDEKVPTLLPQ